MSLEPCPSALLVEAKRDHRLGDREAASVDRHLATCASCAALAADLDGALALLRTPVADFSPLELKRNQLKLIREAVLLPAAPTRPSRRPIQAASLLAAAAIVLLLLVARSRTRQAAFDTTAPPSPIVSVRTVTTISPEGPARFTRGEVDGADVVALSDGGVSFSVRHLAAGERFIVKTSDAEVEVRGTVFRVEAASERLQRVSVIEGQVEVRFGGVVYPLSAGELWSRPVESPVPVPAASVAVATKRKKTAAIPAASAEANHDDSSGDLAEGVGLIRRGDYGAAADRLDAFSKSHPDDERAEDASFLVIVAMQRAGRHAEASAAAARYIARHPSGYRRAEAEAVLAAPFPR
ncbi:MAG: FecR domain-containing protein [Byssovorax sp.]